LLADGGLTASVELLAGQCGPIAGSLRVRGKYGLTSHLALPGWTVRPDLPPSFTAPLQLRGVRNQALFDAEHRISPDDPLHLQAVVEDAEGIAEVALEYRINDCEVVSVPWVRAGGKTSVEIDRTWSMPSGMREGDRVRFRLRATDNRLLPTDALGSGL